MSFRKRSIPLTNTAKLTAPASASSTTPPPTKQPLASGVRLSPAFTLPTTSTGLASLDSLLRLGAGLALGSSLVIEEDGTTDYAGAILRCFASEGVLQGHQVFVLAHEAWGAGLPGVAVERESKRGQREKSGSDERMKIAWRYERMGLHGDGRERAGVLNSTSTSNNMPFCHTFDLSTRLERPSSSPSISYLPPQPGSKALFPDLSPLTTYLKNHPKHLPVRLIIPSLLSPLFYAPVTNPHPFIRYLHTLRLLHQEHSSLTTMISWPLALYSTQHPLTWWLERLSDGVIRLDPFPHSFSADAVILADAEVNPGSSKKDEEKIQGLLRVKKLPVLTERGMGIGEVEDMAWSLGRKKFIIRPFNLPPLEVERQEDTEAAQKAKELEF